MATVFEFLKHILNTGKPDKNPVELSLYNVIKNFASSESEKIDRDFLISTYRKILLFPYWRNKQAELDSTLKTWFRTYSKVSSHDLDPIYFADLQLLKVQKPENTSALLKEYFSKIYPGAKLQCVDLGKGSFLILCLKTNSELSIHICNNEFLIFDGKIEPLILFFHLHYNQSLELDTRRRHCMATKNFRIFQIENNGKEWEILETAGYSFKKQRESKLVKFEDYPELFYSMKAIESKFVQKSSDPLYLKITREIEIAIENLAGSGDFARDEATKTYQKARNIFDHIFPDDRLLHLLLKELALLLANDTQKDPIGNTQEIEEEWQKIQTNQALDLINLLPIVE